MAKLDIGIIVYNSVDKLPALLEKARECGQDYKITVINNTVDSEKTKEILALLREGENHVFTGENLLFSKSANRLMQETSGDYVTFLCGEHTEILDPTWADECVKILDEHEKVAIIGCAVTTHGLWHYKAWATLGLKPMPTLVVPQVIKHIEKFPREYVFDQKIQKYIHGSAFVLSRKAYEAIGPFDEDFAHALSDAEYTLRILLNGWGVCALPAIGCESVPGAMAAVGTDMQFKVTHVYPPGAKNVWSEDLS